MTDHGPLVALTADFDAHFVGSVARMLTLAAVSAPLPASDVLPGSDVLPEAGGPQLGDGGGRRGATLGIAEEPGGGGGLPFTGFLAAAIATVGAGLSAAGVALRAKLRRHH